MADFDPAHQLATVRAEFPASLYTIHGTAWEYIAAGHGTEVLLLLPGALGVAETSFAYILAFAPTYSVLSLSYPAAIDNIHSLADGIAAFLAGMEVPKAHVVGGSFSGFVAQYLAAWHPECIASLLLSNTGAPRDRRKPRYQASAHLLALLPEQMVHMLMRSRIRSFLAEENPVQHFWRNYFTALIPTFSRQALVNRLRLQAQMDDARQGRVLDEHRWDGPTLIVDAGDDGLISYADRARLVWRLPQANVVTLADRGHVASLDATATYIELYREFLCNLPNQVYGSTA